MRRYRVVRPCPELSEVVARMSSELGPGEEALVESEWSYVVEDLRAWAPRLGLEILEVGRGDGTTYVRVRRTAQGRPPQP